MSDIVSNALRCMAVTADRLGYGKHAISLRREAKERDWERGYPGGGNTEPTSTDGGFFIVERRVKRIGDTMFEEEADRLFVR